MILNGDALHIPLADCSVDSIVCDPPYGLSSGKTKYIGESGTGGGFMGKKWDHGVPGVEFWIEALRVAKPGAHMLAFGGSRTYHRLTCAIEDAGWEIRDCIMWVYGSGFPKSCNVSKQLDKSAGAEREVIGPNKFELLNGKSNLNCYGKASRPNETAPSTEQAKQWDGWGSALKPAYEPVILARKPLDGTIAQNVLKWGCGGINIDGCRIGTEPPSPRNAPKKIICGGKFHSGSEADKEMSHYNPASGRFPSNFIHDGSDDVVSLFPVTTSGTLNGQPRKGGNTVYSQPGATEGTPRYHSGDSGSASRFFKCCPPEDAQRIVYSSKASKADRDKGLDGLESRDAAGVAYTTMAGDGRDNPEIKPAKRRNHHPTVKSTSLMQYLCKLITPPNGIILDPFCGSGSTGKAAAKEGFQFIGIEKEWEYCQIAKARCDFETRKPNQMRLAA